MKVLSNFENCIDKYVNNTIVFCVKPKMTKNDFLFLWIFSQTKKIMNKTRIDMTITLIVNMTKEHLYACTFLFVFYVIIQVCKLLRLCILFNTVLCYLFLT